MSSNLRLIVTVMLLMTAVLACNYPIRGRQVNQAAQSSARDSGSGLQEDIDQAFEELQKTGRVRLVIGEEELFTFLQSELDKQASPRLENSHVYLQDGEMRVTGEFVQGGFRSDLALVLKITVTADGKPHYEIVSATIGSLPLTQAVLNNLSQRIDSMFQAYISPKIQHILIEDITISGGEMIIVGRSIM